MVFLSERREVMKRYWQMSAAEKRFFWTMHDDLDWKEEYEKQRLRKESARRFEKRWNEYFEKSWEE